MEVHDISEMDGRTNWKTFAPATCWKLVYSPNNDGFVGEYYMRTTSNEVWPFVNLRTGENRMPRDGDRFLHVEAKVHVREL